MKTVKLNIQQMGQIANADILYHRHLFWGKKRPPWEFSLNIVSNTYFVQSSSSVVLALWASGCEAASRCFGRPTVPLARTVLYGAAGGRHTVRTMGVFQKSTTRPDQRVEARACSGRVTHYKLQDAAVHL